MILEKHTEKVIRFEKLRRKLKTTFNDSFDRHLANVAHESPEIQDIKSKEQVVLTSLELLIEKTRLTPSVFTNPDEARKRFECEVRRIKSNGIQATSPLHLADGFLPKWYLHTNQLSPDYKMFVERNKRKIIVMRLVK